MTRDAPGLGEQIRRNAQCRIGGRRCGDQKCREQSEQGERDTGRADPGGAVRQQYQCAARDGATDDRQERRRLDHAVAGDQFVLGEMLGQQTVLHRPEQRGLHAETGQHDQQPWHALGQERRGCRCHQQHLGQFVDQDDARLWKPVRQLARGGGEQNVGCDEQRPSERRQPDAANAELEQRQHDHGVLHQVVVQRPAGLRQHQRPQATGLQQSDRRDGHGGVPFVHDRARQHMATISSARCSSPPCRRP